MLFIHSTAIDYWLTLSLYAGVTIGVTNPASSSVTVTSGGAYNITWVSGLSSQALVSITLQQAGQSAVYVTLATNITNLGRFSWVVSVLLPAGYYYIVVSTVNLSPTVIGAGPMTGTFAIAAGSLLRCFSSGLRLS